jgi:hypothetical protein
MPKMRPGTTWAVMPDNETHYVIERWNGRRWVVVPEAGTFDSKREADRWGFTNNQAGHRK